LILAGTRAEYIKLAPLIKLLDDRRIQYRLIDTGQHRFQAKDIRKQLDIREPDYYLCSNGASSGLRSKLVWLVGITLVALRGSPSTCDFDLDPTSHAIVHGDTLSTLFSLILCKRCRLRVAHIESGLSSCSVFEPFPEELIRRFVCRYADVGFYPDALPARKSKKWHQDKLRIHTDGNTGLDAFSNAVQRVVGVEDAESHCPSFCVVAVHRMENLFIPWRRNDLIAILESISKMIKIVFVGYGNTLSQFNQVRSWKALLRSKQVEVIPPCEYSAFVSLMMHSRFVVTDGGSIQEECGYLRHPCLILRRKTERTNGLGENAAMISPTLKNLELIRSWVLSSPNRTFPAEVGTTKHSPTMAVLDSLLKIGWLGSGS